MNTLLTSPDVRELPPIRSATSADSGFRAGMPRIRWSLTSGRFCVLSETGLVVSGSMQDGWQAVAINICMASHNVYYVKSSIDLFAGLVRPHIPTRLFLSRPMPFDSIQLP